MKTVTFCQIFNTNARSRELKNLDNLRLTWITQV